MSLKYTLLSSGSYPSSALRHPVKRSSVNFFSKRQLVAKNDLTTRSSHTIWVRVLIAKNLRQCPYSQLWTFKGSSYTVIWCGWEYVANFEKDKSFLIPIVASCSDVKTGNYSVSARNLFSDRLSTQRTVSPTGSLKFKKIYSRLPNKFTKTEVFCLPSMRPKISTFYSLKNDYSTREIKVII